MSSLHDELLATPHHVSILAGRPWGPDIVIKTTITGDGSADRELAMIGAGDTDREPLSNGSRSISTSLLGRLRLRNAEAWVRLAKLFQPVVYDWVRKSGLQPADAEEVTQEVLLSVDAHIASFHRDQSGDTFRGWLWTITRNKIREHHRRCHGQAQGEGGSDAQRRLAQVPEECPGSVSSETDADVKSRLVRGAAEMIRAEFEDRTWQAFCHRTFDAWSAAEVAAKLGMTQAAVHKARSRVMKRLREELEGLLD